MSRVDLSTLGRSFFTKVHRLVAQGRLAELKYFLSTHPVSLDEPCPVDGLLDYALESGDKELAIACLDMGAAVDRDDERFPPLYYAIERADKDLTMFDLLLARGVNPNIRFMNDHTPLHVCAIDDKPRAVERLLAANADANAETRIDDYFTPLMEASSRGHVGIVQQLLQAGANPDFVNLCGQTVISVAAKRSREQIKEAISTFKRKHTTKE